MTYEEVEVSHAIHFTGGLPGFPRARRFLLEQWGGDDSPFSLLTSLDEAGLEFLVTPPGAFFPDYEIEIDDDTAAQLGLSSAEDAIVLVIVTVTDRAEDATANLLGPLVINRHTREGVQAVLAGSGYVAQERLVRA